MAGLASLYVAAPVAPAPPPPAPSVADSPAGDQAARPVTPGTSGARFGGFWHNPTFALVAILALAMGAAYVANHGFAFGFSAKVDDE